MNAMRDDLLRPVPVVPPLGWWVFGLAVAGAAILHPLAGLGLFVLVLIQRARPLDFLTSYLVVVVLGSFVNYGNHTLTYQLTILTGFILFSMYCYVLSRRWDSVVWPRTPATAPLVAFTALTFANFVRGLMIGNSPKYAGLELFIVLVLGTSFLVASRRWSKTELRYALFVVWLMGCGHFLLGAYIYMTIHVRTVGVYFTGASSVVAMLLLNFALRARNRITMLMWLVAMAPLLAHEFLSFTRGYWLATFVATAFSIAMYVGRTGDVRYRLGRATVVLGLWIVVTLVGSMLMASVIGLGHALELASNRLASSTATEYSWQTQSNFVRLLESVRVLEMIAQNPIFGHGLGYFFVIRDPIQNQLIEQHFNHENYLWITLKQGLIGLAIWIWMFIGFLRTGVRGRSLPDVEEQSWCTGTAAVVLWVMVYMLFHFPMMETNTTLPFALMLGATMRYVATDTIALRWQGRRTQPSS